MRGMSKNSIRSRPAGGRADPDRLALHLARSTTATVASASTCSGSCQLRQRRRLVAAQDQHQLVRRATRSRSTRSVSAVYDGPSRSHLDPRHAKRSSPADGQLAQLQPHLGAGVVRRAPMRRLAHRHQQHAVQLELAQRLLRADQMAHVRRVEGAAEDAYAQPRYSRICPAPSTTNL